MSTDQLVTHVLAGTAVVVLLAHLLGALATRLGQPEVIGEIFAGIALGPSLLGQLPGDLTGRLFPVEVVPYLQVVSQVALVFFLFSVGYELDLRVLRRTRRAVPAVTVTAFAIPMALGAGAAYLLGSLYTPPGGPAPDNVGFVLFLAVSMALTAVPVLASIVRERGAADSLPGVVAMTSAGLMDAAGWLVLAAAVMIGGTSPHDHMPLPATLALFAVYALAMVYVARLLLRRWLRRPGALPRRDVPVIVALATASAWATSALGLHVIFGAFVAGLIMPRNADGTPHEDLMRPLQETGNLLLPLFFVVSGLSVDIGSLTGKDCALLAILTLIAVAGKLGGGTLGARLGGLSSRDATIIGVMLNTRGLTELVALNIGLQSGIIDERLYTVLVIVALLTTVVTGPLLTLLRFPQATERGTGDTVAAPRSGADDLAPASGSSGAA
ncbi:MAG: cation:proton antiporter [Streptomycetaceae bacterium]|nr:cation:proton antiporter [Streptomycetaceae bacterium]